MVDCQAADFPVVAERRVVGDREARAAALALRLDRLWAFNQQLLPVVSTLRRETPPDPCDADR